jgi:peptidoglycan hydrolase CwlO-like protein
MDTKLSKLQDKLEDMTDDISDKDKQISDLQDTIKKSETGSLAKRITELTTKMD